MTGDVKDPQGGVEPTRSVELAVERLQVGYPPGPPVLHDVHLTATAGTLTALLGPSGCGKTTLLKAVAGLVEPGSGDVRIGGSSILGQPAERRPVGLVFQKPLLFPHLSVGDNIGFGLRMRGVGRRARRAAVERMLDLVQLPGLAGRRPGELSGGQEQRVALARALVLDPQVLLLDEPFSQLDADLRIRMRELVRRLQRELAITTLFVTHDQQEAVVVADRIALMIDGRIEADGTPAEFYTRPATLRAARFFGGTNEIPGEVSGRHFGCAMGTLRLPAGLPDGPGVLVVRPEALRLAAGDAGGGAPGEPACDAGTIVAATVRSVRFRGTHQTVSVDLDGGISATVTTHPGAGIDEGAAVAVQFPVSSCHVVAHQHDHLRSE